MGYPIKNGNTTRNLVFLMIDSTDHISGKTGLTPTVKISKNGAAGVSPSGAVSAVDATNMPGWYQLAANATDANTGGALILHATATGADPCDEQFQVVAYDPDALATQTGDSYARLGAPAGASVSADVAAVKASVGTPQQAGSAVSLPSSASINITGNITGNLSGSVGSVTGAVGSVTGAVGSVTGSVGSISGVTFPSGFSTLTVANIQSGLATSTAVAAIPTNPLTTLGSTAPAGWINAAAIAAAALNGKGDWLLSSGYTAPPTAVAIRTEMDANSTRLAHLQADVTSTPAGVGAAMTLAAGSIVTTTFGTCVPVAAFFTNAAAAPSASTIAAAILVTPSQKIVTDASGYVTANVSGSITVSGDVTLAASQPNYAPAKAGDAMTLTSAYDAAKSAASATALSNLQTHGDSAWATATGFATSSALSSVATAVAAIPTNPLTTLGTNAPAGWINAAAIASSALNGKGDWLLASGYTAPPSSATIASAAAAAILVTPAQKIVTDASGYVTANVNGTITVSGSVVLNASTGWGGSPLPTSFTASNLPSDYLSSTEQTQLATLANGSYGLSALHTQIGTPMQSGAAVTLAATQPNYAPVKATDLPANFGSLVITNGQTVGTSTYAGGAVASVTGNVGGISGVTFPTRFGSLAIDTYGYVTCNNTMGIVVRTGTCQGGTTTTVQLDAGASAANNIYNGLLLYISNGQGMYQARTITGYNGVTKFATLDRALIVAPINGSTFMLLPADNPSLNASLQVSASVARTVVRSGTCQNGGSSNTVKLDAGASATNNIYNSDLLTITGGTGVGQTRTVVSYNGSTKIATVDATWISIPVAGSTFDLYASTDPTLFSDQGVAQGGSSNTIILATTASSVDGVYNGSLINILSGTGDGETAEISSYVGATRTATIVGTWGVSPDATSAYAVIPAVQNTPSNSAPTLQQITSAILKSGNPIAADSNGYVTFNNADVATGTEIANLQSHGDSTWSTATGFATPANVTSAVTSIESHGDANWMTATGFATATALSSVATAVAAIPTTTLLAANYTAPDNADIVTIKNAVTDGTSGLPALHTQVAGVLPLLEGLAIPVTITGATSPAGYNTDYFYNGMLNGYPYYVDASGSYAIWQAYAALVGYWFLGPAGSRGTILANGWWSQVVSDGSFAPYGNQFTPITDSTGFTGTPAASLPSVNAQQVAGKEESSSGGGLGGPLFAETAPQVLASGSDTIVVHGRHGGHAHHVIQLPDDDIHPARWQGWAGGDPGQQRPAPDHPPGHRHARRQQRPFAGCDSHAVARPGLH